LNVLQHSRGEEGGRIMLRSIKKYYWMEKLLKRGNKITMAIFSVFK
jgi:hypothetical protein